LDNLASVVVVTYNHAKYIEPCLSSLVRQTFPCEIIVVDNGSDDETCEIIETRFPGITLIHNRNTGYGAGNNLGVTHSGGRYVIILNPDTVLDEDCVKELVQPLQAGEKIITNPKILVYDGSSINTIGNTSHFTGLSFTRGLGEPIANYSNPCYLSGVSGACFALTRDDYDSLGGFDENYFLYSEDVEFSWNAHSRDFKLLFVPGAVVYHDYELDVSAAKLYYLELGRYMLLRKYFGLKDVFLTVPGLIMTEILVAGYSGVLGTKGPKCLVRAKKDAFRAKIDIRPGYQKIFVNLSQEIPTDQLNRNKLDKIVKKIANRIFRCNYRLARWVYDK
jgi:GT2 family glycosyltransferase